MNMEYDCHLKVSHILIDRPTKKDKSILLGSQKGGNQMTDNNNNINSSEDIRNMMARLSMTTKEEDEEGQEEGIAVSDDDTTILLCRDDEVSIFSFENDDIDQRFEAMYSDFYSQMGASYNTQTSSFTDFTFDTTGSFMAPPSLMTVPKQLLPHLGEREADEHDDDDHVAMPPPKMTRSVSNSGAPSPSLVMTIRQQRQVHLQRSMSQSVLFTSSSRSRRNLTARSASRKRIDAV